MVSEVNKMKRSFFTFPTVIPINRSRLAGDQLQKDIQLWLSPPDPSTNHRIAWKAHHIGTAGWFFDSSVLADWKSRGSLLWIHGKRALPNWQRTPRTDHFPILQLVLVKARF